MKSLCENCDSYERVESREVGVMLRRCSALKIDLSHVGEVERCTDYQAKDLPWVFEREAWKLFKNKKGQWVFVDPHLSEKERTKLLGVDP